jgi:hypothetical protein
MSYIGADELIFNRDLENEVYSGGFSVESIMLKNGLSPITTFNNQLGGTNKVSDLFHNLAVPNWLLSSYKHDFLHGGGINSEHEVKHDEKTDVIENDLHDILLELVREKKHKKTRRIFNKNKNQSKKLK